MNNKQCSKCLVEKNIQEFSKDKYAFDGYRYNCKSCCNAYRGKRLQKEKEYQHKKYLENKEAYLTKHKKWNFENKEKIKVYNRRHRESRNKYANKIRKELRLQIINHYGAKCSNIDCADNRLECLTIDHINNDGHKQRKTHGSGLNFYRWIIKNNYPTDLQLLCYNCNCVKAFFGYYPSKRS